MSKLLEDATEQELLAMWLRRARERESAALTRGGQAEVRHVCLYASGYLMQLRDEVVRPEMTAGHAVLALREAIVSLESLIAYLEHRGGGMSWLGRWENT